MTERWVFGVEPLAQTARAAALLRRVTSLLLAADRDDDAVDALIGDLERAAGALGHLPADAPPRIGGADGRPYVDHARDVGAYDPCFPEYEIDVDGDRATGTVTFPIAYEGPPGLVHGGFLGVFFDCVVQHHNCDVGVAGKTTAMAIRYRRPTPLLTPLAFTVERAQGDDRIRSTARLLLADEVLCEAEVDAIVGRRDDLPDVGARR